MSRQARAGARSGSAERERSMAAVCPTRARRAASPRGARGLQVVEAEPARDDARVADHVARRVRGVLVDQTAALEAALERDLTVAKGALDEACLRFHRLAIHRDHGVSLRPAGVGPSAERHTPRAAERPSLAWPRM